MTRMTGACLLALRKSLKAVYCIMETNLLPYQSHTQYTLKKRLKIYTPCYKKLNITNMSGLCVVI
jgi:hypothetical protein